jgi:DNA-binding response OmpR family regulator
MVNPDRPDDAHRLDGATILLVEDEPLVGMEVESVLRDAGARDVTLCGSVTAALACADHDGFNIAILDVRLHDGMVIPVARRLAERGVPFLFYTGQTRTDPIFAEWPDSTIITKPARDQTILNAVETLLRP